MFYFFLSFLFFCCLTHQSEHFCSSQQAMFTFGRMIFACICWYLFSYIYTSDKTSQLLHVNPHPVAGRRSMTFRKNRIHVEIRWFCYFHCCFYDRIDIRNCVTCPGIADMLSRRNDHVYSMTQIQLWSSFVDQSNKQALIQYNIK